MPALWHHQFRDARIVQINPQKPQRQSTTAQHDGPIRRIGDTVDADILGQPGGQWRVRLQHLNALWGHQQGGGGAGFWLCFGQSRGQSFGHSLCQSQGRRFHRCRHHRGRKGRNRHRILAGNRWFARHPHDQCHQAGRIAWRQHELRHELAIAVSDGAGHLDGIDLHVHLRPGLRPTRHQHRAIRIYPNQIKARRGDRQSSHPRRCDARDRRICHHRGFRQHLRGWALHDWDLRNYSLHNRLLSGGDTIRSGVCQKGDICHRLGFRHQYRRLGNCQRWAVRHRRAPKPSGGKACDHDDYNPTPSQCRGLLAAAQQCPSHPFPLPKRNLLPAPAFHFSATPISQPNATEFQGWPRR